MDFLLKPSNLTQCDNEKPCALCVRATVECIDSRPKSRWARNFQLALDTLQLLTLCFCLVYRKQLRIGSEKPVATHQRNLEGTPRENADPVSPRLDGKIQTAIGLPGPEFESSPSEQEFSAQKLASLVSYQERKSSYDLVGQVSLTFT